MPAEVPVNVTEQLPADNVHVLELNKPPVVPAVSVKVTVPVGTLAGLVVSATVAVKVAVQLVALSPMLQLTSGTVVIVASFEVTVTVMVATALVLVL